MDKLKILSREHDRWRHMALSICGDDSLADDIVQDMYLRIDKYVTDITKIYDEDKDEINSFYIFVTIKNVFFHWFNQQRKFHAFELKEFDFNNEDLQTYNDQLCDSSLDDDIEMLDMERANHVVIEKILAEIKDWHWYDEKLFKLYFMTDMSLRDVAKETKISLTSIYNSVKNYREFIYEKFNEDVEDLYNEDYSKIK